jgi:hypothetical protein
LYNHAEYPLSARYTLAVYADLIDSLATTPKALAHLVAEASDARLDASTDAEWSARTLLAHFRDDEYLCMRVALERMLAEELPAVHFIEGDDWEPSRNRTRDRKEVLLADFALQRQASISILRGLREEDWARTGIRGELKFTVRQLVEGWIGHDREHVAQVETALGETLRDVQARRARMPN